MIEKPCISRFSTVIEMGMRGWIIDGIAKEAAAAISLKNTRIYVPTRRHHQLNPRRLIDLYRLRNSDDLLFMHFRLFFRYREKFSSSNMRVFITHLDSKELLGVHEIRMLNDAQRLIFQNKTVLDFAVSLGVNSEKCLIGHGAVSERDFFPSSEFSPSSYVLISGECKPRKNPDLVRKVILTNPDLYFVIHGLGWEAYFKSYKPKNLRLLPFDKIKHPELMRNASLALSLAKNEGGPFAILEALASGTPVVCSRTGFATEVVSSECGMVLSAQPSLKEISNAMRKSILLKQKIYGQNLLPSGHDWRTFAQILYLI